MSKIFTKDTLKQVADLSHLPIPENKIDYYAKQFNETLEVIDTLNSVDTKNIPETSQVTGLINRFRDDKLNSDKTMSQEEALSSAGKTYNGFFVVEGVLDEK